MKKLIALFVLICAFSLAFSQNFPQLTIENKNLIKKDFIQNSKFATFGYWYNYALSMEDSLQIGELNSTFLFPDTNINAIFQSGISKPWLHSALVVIDLESSVFNQQKLNGSKSSFALDSIEIFGKYQRNLIDSSIVDTLIIEVIQLDLNLADIDTLNLPDSVYGTEIIKYVNLNQNLNLASVPNYNRRKMKIPLDEFSAADTLNSGINHYKIALDSLIYFSGLLNKHVYLINYQFKPGYNYSANDTLNNMNYFQILSLEENGLNTFPAYEDGTFNTSYIVNTESKYNTSFFWYDNFIPTWAFDKDYAFENHLAGFVINVYGGFDEIENAEISQNFPNPVNDKTTIEYYLNAKSEVSLNIYNVTGKLVFEKKIRSTQSGINSITLDLSHLSPGLYYYNLSNANKKSNSKKMIVY
jgi:hypothetical protein